MKLAVSVIAEFMVTVAGLFVPEYDPEPDPDQPVKLKPPLGVAVIETEVPASYQPVSPEIVGSVLIVTVP